MPTTGTQGGSRTVTAPDPAWGAAVTCCCAPALRACRENAASAAASRRAVDKPPDAVGRKPAAARRLKVAARQGEGVSMGGGQLHCLCGLRSPRLRVFRVRRRPRVFQRGAGVCVWRDHKRHVCERCCSHSHVLRTRKGIAGGETVQQQGVRMTRLPVIADIFRNKQRRRGGCLCVPHVHCAIPCGAATCGSHARVAPLHPLAVTRPRSRGCKRGASPDAGHCVIEPHCGPSNHAMGGQIDPPFCGICPPKPGGQLWGPRARDVAPPCTPSRRRGLPEPSKAWAAHSH